MKLNSSNKPRTFPQGIKPCGKVRGKFGSLVLLLAALFFLLAALFFFARELIGPKNVNAPVVPVIEDQPQNFRLLDGQPVAVDKISLKPIAVVLENHFESRPISGLEYASVIYETVVEGDITRFLAIFDSDITAKKIGSIRSVRPFFVELAEEWNAVLFHAGGSQDAMYKLTYSPVKSINEISGDGIYFWRDGSRQPPHNLYTSANLISRALTAKEIDPIADFSPWLFKEDLNQGLRIKNQGGDSVKVEFRDNPLYQVEYKYNWETNDYTRYLADQIHKTDRGIILKAKNVVVQHVRSKVLDDYGRLAINLQSGGLAEIYQAGSKIEGRWQRVDRRTRFYDFNGKEIEFNRGVIWVELVFD